MTDRRFREDRKTVRIGVRVRTDTGWIDATVCNVSTRGMMLHSAGGLQRNQFVEITRGRARVIGRVVWSDESKFGLQAQDAVDITALLQKPGTNPAAVVGEHRFDRRSAPPVRTYVALDRTTTSRLVGRAMDLATVVLVFAIVSILTVSSALEAAEKPLAQVHGALATDSH